MKHHSAHNLRKPNQTPRKEVQKKEKALAELEQDLENLTESKRLLESNIELESQALETARQQYDNLEKERETAETNFSERLAASAPASELQQLRQRVAETQQQLRDSRTAIRESTDRLQALRNQLLASQNEETALVKQSEELIPNGQITAVQNSTEGWARVVLDVGVAYEEQIDQVIEVLTTLASDFTADPAYSNVVLDDPEMFGVDALADSSVVVKLGLKVRPDKQWAIKRELLRRIKRRFDELGIEIPFPQQTVHHRMENGKVFPTARR